MKSFLIFRISLNSVAQQCSSSLEPLVSDDIPHLSHQLEFNSATVFIFIEPLVSDGIPHLSHQLEFSSATVFIRIELLVSDDIPHLAHQL